jgi:hypothetical protein
MKKIFTLILILTFALSNAQNSKRGYKSLEKKDYAKGKEAFAKVIASNRNDVAANFGMALVLADEKSPYFNIIEAWQYVERIEGKTSSLSQEEIEVIGEYFMNTEVRRTSRPVKKKIEIALEAIEARLIKFIREENNLDACYEVLKRYPNFRHYDNVVHIRNQFEYRKYEKQNTLEAYKEFISKFPDAAQVDKAKRQINKLSFEKAKQQNTVSGYNNYITSFPESEFIQAAIKLRNAAAFAEVKRINTLIAFDTFIESYPDALEVGEAKRLQQNILYEKAKRVKSLEAYNAFIDRYPDGMYFIDIFNLKAAELGAKFVQENNFASSSLAWARGFDNNGRIESGGAIAVSNRGDIIVACNTRENDTSYADAWVIKLDNTGKMLWNKTIGQAFEDSISTVLIDSKGNIIVLGYTHVSADSASRMGWMFKLGTDGKKLWNKNLGKTEIKSCAIDRNDRIYIGGSIAKDSLGNHYALTVFNSEARKVSERTYTGRGSINDINIDQAGNMLLCGSNWLLHTDTRRYILWDQVLDPSLTATHCTNSTNSGFYFAGANNNKIFYAGYGSNGKKLWLQSYDKSDISQTIRGMAVVSQGNLIVLEQKGSGAKIKTFSPAGSVVKVKELGGNNSANHIVSNSNGVFLALNNGDLLIFRFMPLSSL